MEQATFTKEHITITLVVSALGLVLYKVISFPPSRYLHCQLEVYPRAESLLIGACINSINRHSSYHWNSGDTRSSPITGHLLELGDDHASLCEGWWRKYNYPIFQIRLGNTRAVVVNSFTAAQQMLIGNQSAVIDRPTLHTFHGVISSTKGFTIGSKSHFLRASFSPLEFQVDLFLFLLSQSAAPLRHMSKRELLIPRFLVKGSPWDASCKAKHVAAGQALGRSKIRDYYDMMDLESYCVVRDLARSSQTQEEVSVREFIQRYALNTTLTLCYEIR